MCSNYLYFWLKIVLWETEKVFWYNLTVLSKSVMLILSCYYLKSIGVLSQVWRGSRDWAESVPVWQSEDKKKWHSATLNDSNRLHLVVVVGISTVRGFKVISHANCSGNYEDSFLMDVGWTDAGNTNDSLYLYRSVVQYKLSTLETTPVYVDILVTLTEWTNYKTSVFILGTRYLLSLMIQRWTALFDTDIRGGRKFW